MTLDEFLAQLRQLPDVVLHPGAADDAIDAVERRYGIRLPALHRELLLRTNGIEANGGYLRLYGAGPEAGVDMGWWNEPDLWKFSWHPYVNQFFCFGGTGWGMQLAYHLADVSSLVSDASVYMLADSDQWAASSRVGFAQYLEGGFLTNARQQRSKFDRKVRKKVGDLRPDELATLAPHPVIGGPERVANVVKMPAVTAMVINGDTNTELVRVTEGFARDGEVSRVVPYVDENGRGRIRLEFEAFESDAG